MRSHAPPSRPAPPPPGHPLIAAWPPTLSDERHRGIKGALIKAAGAAANLNARHRLLLTPASAAGGGSVDELMARASFLHKLYQASCGSSAG